MDSIFWGRQNLHFLGLIKMSLRSPKEAKKCKGKDTSMLPSFYSPNSDISGGQSYHLHHSLSLEPVFIIHLPGAMLLHKNRVYYHLHIEGRQPVQADAVPCTEHQCCPRPLSVRKPVFSGTAECWQRQDYHWFIPFSSFVHAFSEALILLDQD